MENEKRRYENAKKRVKEEQKFYNHLIAYLVINTALIIFKLMLLPNVLDFAESDQSFEKIMQWNTVSTPILWGIGLAIHGLWTFRRTILPSQMVENSIFSQKWEERKIKEFMENDNF